MRFIEIATAAAKRGLAVYPTEPGERGPKGLRATGWTTGASTDPAQIAKWAQQWPDSNCLVVANPATSIVLDIDNPELAANHGFPFHDCEQTLWIRTPGKGLHLHFDAGHFANQITSNRGIKLDGELAVEYKYRGSSVAAPGTVRADGGQYVIERDNPKRNIPISVMAWLLERIAPEVNGKTRGIPVHEDFEFDELTDFFDVEIINVSGIWHTPRICPIKGDWHTNNGKPDFGATGFAWDDKNRTLGWKDHAQTCDGAQMNVKQVIDFLVEQKGEEYPYPLFASGEPIPPEGLPGFEVATVDEEIVNAALVAEAEMPVAIQHDEELNKLSNADEMQQLWKEAKVFLDEIRKGERLVENEDGKTKLVKLDRHLIDEKVFNFVLKTLLKKMGARQFVDAYPYLFLPLEKAIYDLHNPEQTYRILSRIGLLKEQHDYKLVDQNLFQNTLYRGEQTRIEKFGCMKGDAIYVHNGRNGMIKITVDGFAEVDNGTDGVYMKNRSLTPWPVLNMPNIGRLTQIAEELGPFGGRVTDSPLCRYLNALFDEGFLTGPQYQQLVVLRFLSLFVGNALDLRPIMMALGPQNSGKSTLWEKFMWLFYGVKYESGGLPTKMRDFIAAITNHQIQLFDNIDRADFNSAKSEQVQYIDPMCKCSTGGRIAIAQLYKNNVDKDYQLRCDLFLTSRTNPFPSQYTDLLRRIQIFPIRRPTAEEYRTTESMKEEFVAQETDIKLEVLAR
jgi:hypothetical protein